MESSRKQREMMDYNLFVIEKTESMFSVVQIPYSHQLCVFADHCMQILTILNAYPCCEQ